MPAPVKVECPVCFETLKLKAAPKPGARMKCPHCSTVFSPGGDDEPAPVEEDDEDDVPVRASRPKARSKSSKGKKKSKPVNLVLPIIVGVIALVVIGGGIGLYAARDSLAKLFRPSVDVSYFQVPHRSMNVRIKVQEFLNSPAVSDKVKSGPAFGESSAALQELLGIEIRDLDSMTAEFHLPAGLGPIPPTDGIVILRSSKALRAPAATTYDVEGVPCYTLDVSGSFGRGPKLDTLLIANRTTAIIGREPTIRSCLANWKSRTRAPNHLPDPGNETVSMGIDKTMLTGMFAPFGGMAANPMMGNQGMELQQSISKATLLMSGVSVAGQINGSAINWSVVFHCQDVKAETLQTSIEEARGKMRAPIDTALAAGAILPEEARKALETAKQMLSAPLTPAGNRVTMAIPLPADQQAKSLENMANLIPSFKGLKVSQIASANPAHVNDASADPLTTQIGRAIVAQHGLDKTVTVVFTGLSNLDADVSRRLGERIQQTQGSLHYMGASYSGNYVMVYGGIGDWAAFEQLIGQLGTVTAKNPQTRLITVTLDLAKANTALQ